VKPTGGYTLPCRPATKWRKIIDLTFDISKLEKICCVKPNAVNSPPTGRKN
jgi:hypothetical protein